jgi:hypothetical protein
MDVLVERLPPTATASPSPSSPRRVAFKNGKSWVVPRAVHSGCWSLGEHHRRRWTVQIFRRVRLDPSRYGHPSRLILRAPTFICGSILGGILPAPLTSLPTMRMPRSQSTPRQITRHASRSVSSSTFLLLPCVAHLTIASPCRTSETPSRVSSTPMRPLYANGCTCALRIFCWLTRAVIVIVISHRAPAVGSIRSAATISCLCK